jgi:hypothetical protein
VGVCRGLAVLEACSADLCLSGPRSFVSHPVSLPHRTTRKPINRGLGYVAPRIEKHVFDLLPMIPLQKPWRIALGLFLNAADLFCAFFLFLGGAQLVDRLSFPLGYVVMASALLLLYLSSGVWTSSKWKLKLRLGLYGLATGIFVPSVLLAKSRNRIESPVWVAIVVILVVFIVSAFHLRLVTRSRGEGPTHDGVRTSAK